VQGDAGNLADIDCLFDIVKNERVALTSYLLAPMLASSVSHLAPLPRKAMMISSTSTFAGPCLLRTPAIILIFNAVSSVTPKYYSRKMLMANNHNRHKIFHYPSL
jgi:hypothetical protein